MFPVKSFPLDLRPDVLVGEVDSVLFRECHVCPSLIDRTGTAQRSGAGSLGYQYTIICG